LHSNNIDDPRDHARPRRQSYYEKLKVSLDHAGYDVSSALLDASRYGVPQKRSRLIAIGIRKEDSRFLEGGTKRVFELLEIVRSQQLRRFNLGERVAAAEAISDLEVGDRPLVPCTDEQSRLGYFEAARDRATTVYQRLMRKNSSNTPNSMRLARHRDDVQKRFARILAECRRGVHMSAQDRLAYGLKKHRIHPMSESEPAPTITTLPDDILHYAEPRILTVRESARLQSFPDWFDFKGKFTTGGARRTQECPRYTQVGNAVPPLLARAIGMALTQALQEIDASRKVSPSSRRGSLLATR
jgi:DNA (cytosine-5)-methyltransferase 1